MRAGWIARGTVAVRLGRPHFAFFRGYLDGLDIGPLADRYLASGLIDGDDGHVPGNCQTHVDLRLARSMVVWIRGQLQAAARLRLGASDARLLGIAPSVLRTVQNAASLSLDQFREEHDPDGLFAEQELIALFAQAYPERIQPARQTARSLRLHARQQQTLVRLEQLIGADPRLEDPVASWLDARLADRLTAVNVVTLRQLLDFIDRHGYRWYRKVPRVGLQAALLIAAWLQQDSMRLALGRGMPVHALNPPRAVVHGKPSPASMHRSGALLAALKQRRTDSGMDGARGCNRGRACKIDADDDTAAINAWLTARGTTGHTLRAYRRESERFLLWAVLEAGKPVSALDADDCSRYQQFLAMLGIAFAADWARRFHMPQEDWIAERGVRRTNTYWRPFHGALKVSSQRQSLLIVQSLLHWLFEQGYLASNPADQFVRPAVVRNCPSGGHTVDSLG